MPHINGLVENYHLTVLGFSRETTLIDNGLTQDSSKYVTRATFQSNDD